MGASGQDGGVGIDPTYDFVRVELRGHSPGRPDDARAAFETARHILEPVVAIHDSADHVRKLERARAGLARIP